MVNIVWDNEQAKYEDERYSLVLMTGQSQGFRNHMAALGVTNPRLSVVINREILSLAEQVSAKASDSGDLPGVPEIVVYRRAGTNVALMWAIVPSGAKKRGKLLGQYRFVAVLEEELEDTLSRVFDIERLLSSS